VDLWANMHQTDDVAL